MTQFRVLLKCLLAKTGQYTGNPNRTGKQYLRARQRQSGPKTGRKHERSKDRETRGKARQGIMSIFNPDKVLKPREEVQDETAEAFSISPGLPLHLSVGLGKVCRGEADCGSD